MQSADLVDMMLPLSNFISTIQANYNFICDKHNFHVYRPSELHKLCILLLLTVILSLTEVMVKVKTFDRHQVWRFNKYVMSIQFGKLAMDY